MALTYVFFLSKGLIYLSTGKTCLFSKITYTVNILSAKKKTNSTPKILVNIQLLQT